MASEEQLAQRLQEAGHAHHEAFAHVNGDDPEWHAWYANHLVEDLSSALGVALAEDELAAALADLAERHGSESSDDAWNDYYARELLSRYATR